ncbi:unnamed protein product [Mycena citricolor]|uniref:WD40 repeat-like protein n=1 Tax=Mycena citricolor TaxID=2018698 RepID=A0AAD2HH93_9AGAR|nr:unnamed protein product [Mycena citricolor]CAK5276644.1 unnamed protein product [Mycena citricolor]
MDSEHPADYTWTPPQYNLLKAPEASGVWEVDSSGTLKGNFPRSARWCADGTAALVQCDHREFRILNPSAPAAQAKDSITSRDFVNTFRQPDAIVDYAWYPMSSMSSPAAFCFAASVRETPVKLLDASDGRLRASYRIVDHRERQIAPHSLAFNPTATKLYCGFEDAIEVFDVSRPGEGTRLHTVPKKSSRDGLKGRGIVSSLAFSPSYESGFYAAGTLSSTLGNIAVYSEEQGDVPVLFVEGGPKAAVTQLQFNPMHPHILYAAFRRYPGVWSWDLRANASVPVQIYCPPEQKQDTNQKRRFDIDVAGRYLSHGDQEGNISIHDLSQPDGLSLVLRYPAHKGGCSSQRPAPKANGRISDAIGAVAFHPAEPSLLSVSGSRHFADPDVVSLDSDSGSDSSDEDKSSPIIRRATAPAVPLPKDKSVKLWNLGG